jgi:SAM-dependent methyltransferase
MHAEGVHNLEEWFRWAEEWSMLLRFYGGAGKHSNVLEIGCGSGRIAFPLRYVVGSYDGFDIRLTPIEWLQRHFTPKHPNFRFHFADLNNTLYNEGGALRTVEYQAPVVAESMDVVFAASIFTHMLPDNTLHYFEEAARVLRPGGRCVFSFFLLDNYRQGQARPPGRFSTWEFDFDHYLDEFDRDFALSDPSNPERMTSYSFDLVRRFAQSAGLEISGEPLPGVWSNSFEAPVFGQDVVILRKPER